MLSKWPIRNKLLVGIGLLLVIVATLSLSGFQGIYAYRSLARGVRGRAIELSTATRLLQQVGDLRCTVIELRSTRQLTAANGDAAPLGVRALRATLKRRLNEIHHTVKQYHDYLQFTDLADSQIGQTQDEWQTLESIDHTLAEIDQLAGQATEEDTSSQDQKLIAATGTLQTLVTQLPSYLHKNLREVPVEARSEYRTLIFLTWVTTVSAALCLGLFGKLFYSWIFHPLRVLVEGSRRVAAGEFNHRIALDTHDEMSELAEALNDMTARFQAIRDDLDRQVQERTKQVVRSEQLASVGFLAAGVAHEINNPLASIAMCAESLEGRVESVMEQASAANVKEGAASDDHDVIRTYLRMIQDEAFRCKGITERLLDFSRVGDLKRHNTDLRELVQGVIDMVSHLGKYHDKQVVLEGGDTPIAPVNAQEIKQVVLNLITNALDSLSPGGVVRIEMSQRGGRAVLTFTDNGCGMTDEVRQHLFEPFFTRRRTGQGIGLGLSITYRIITDHGGQIDAHSDGPGRGSQFRVCLPLAELQKEQNYRYQAA